VEAEAGVAAGAVAGRAVAEVVVAGPVVVVGAEAAAGPAVVVVVGAVGAAAVPRKRIPRTS
jgi:hypothetical protein